MFEVGLDKFERVVLIVNIIKLRETKIPKCYFSENVRKRKWEPHKVYRHFFSIYMSSKADRLTKNCAFLPETEKSYKCRLCNKISLLTTLKKGV